jgi:16S rRNA (cytidine1402-2'-O)-methyltransferase
MTPAAKPSGTLYLVATPIGNLEDITFRAIRILKEADVIACEDTRHTQQLLNHYSITTSTVSYHEHNELTRAPELVLQLEEGGHIALVSDAGMPVISDPGYRLVQLAIRHNIPVVPIPGASALVAALSAAGLPVDKFRFLGFLPAKKSQRRKAIEELRGAYKTLVFYEAPHRLVDMLEDVKDVLGDPPVVVAREVTKVHEEFCRGTASEVIARFKKKPVKGEITVLVAPQLATRSAAQDKESIREEVTRLMSAEGLDERAALKLVARTRRIPRSDAYRRMQGEKTSDK